MSINSLLKSPVALAFASLILLFVMALTGIALEKPTGNIAGRISLEQPEFGLQSYDIRQNKVYALATGPLGGETIQRGVWINPDGTFQINRLPVGEYRLKLRATGFSTAHQSGVFVDEGKTTHVPPVSMYILEPSVNIAANSRVFTSRETPYFWINATGASHATIKLYGKDMLDLLKTGREQGLEFSGNLSLYKPWKQKTPFFTEETPLQTIERKLEADTEDWARANIKLDKPLPAGDYVATVEVKNLKGQTDWNLMWFSVSDIGLIVKQAPEKTLVRAIDLNTLRPVPGVDVSLRDKNDPAQVHFAAQKTDDRGFTTFQLSRQFRQRNYYNLLAYGELGEDKAYGGIDYWSGHTDQYETYFYTERPIYRLGQSVYFKGISRILASDGYQSPRPGTEVTVTIEDPDNNKLWSEKLCLNNHGTFNGLYAIPADGKTGAYQVTIAYPDGTRNYQRFEVAQYRKPEYQVEVIPINPRVEAGGKVKARVRATYFFGAPVTNARVKYSVYAATDWSSRYDLMNRPSHHDYFDDWEEDDYNRGYAGQYITEGFAQTNEAGEAIVEFSTPAMQLPKDEPYATDFMDKRYTIQAEVTDLSRMSVVGSGTVQVTAGRFALFINPENYVYRSGEPVEATVTAVSYEGEPIPNQRVEVSLRRWKWDAVSGEFRGYSTEETQSVITDQEGRARVRLETGDKLVTDSYMLTALSQDEHAHPVFDQNSVWIASENYPYVRGGDAARQEAFAVKLDKAVYEPGETAKVMITAPVSGKENAQVLVTVEGLQLYETRVVPMNATARMVEIPIKENYAPNVYVAATLVGPKHQFYHQDAMIKVSPENNFLKLSVVSDKPRYKPGETAIYTIKAEHADGRPAHNTELSLGVVDESIYSIRPEAARDIRRFFYRQRPNLVNTISSFPEEYSGGPDKIEPRIRKDFRDVADWQPVLVTDENGVAIARVKLPDNLTTWRATVRGINGEASVGSAVHKILSTQDILVRLALPRFYTQYDRGTVTAIVHNYSEQAQTIRLALEMTPQLITGDALTQQLSLKPEEAKRYTWPVTAERSGEATVLIQAVGQTGGDAMELKLPVRPLGYQASNGVSHFTDDTRDTITLPLQTPPEVSPEQAQVLLSLAASSIGPVLDGFELLIDYPYGCTEQTMSRLMPSVIAHRISRELGVSLPPQSQAKFEEVYGKGIARLRDYRHADGGWGWWQYDDSTAYMTAYVMEGLYRLEEAGQPVQLTQDGTSWKKEGLTWLNRASETLTRQLGDPKLAKERWSHPDRLIDLAYMQYVRSLYGEKMPAVTREFLLKRQKDTPPEALAYQTLAFAELNDGKATRQSLEALNRLSDRSGNMIHWDHTPALQKKLGYESPYYTYRFTGTEGTALALRASVAGGAPESRLEAIKQWLILQRNEQGWDNTKTTAQVLLALTEEAAANEKSRTADYKVISELWTDPLVFNAQNRFGPEQRFRWSLEALKGNSITLRKEGPGRLYYRMLLTYLMPLRPGDAVKQTAVPAGLKISRAFYPIEAKATSNGSTLRLQAKSSPASQVRAGETVLMKILVDSPVALPYVIVDAALPSGGEVLSEDPRAHQIGRESGDAFVYDWGSWWWSHQDVLDDRVVLFARSLPAGKSEFHALVRMELPGHFQMNPVQLEGMYSKHVRAVSSLDSIKVVE